MIGDSGTSSYVQTSRADKASRASARAYAVSTCPHAFFSFPPPRAIG